MMKSSIILSLVSLFGSTDAFGVNNNYGNKQLFPLLSSSSQQLNPPRRRSDILTIYDSSNHEIEDAIILEQTEDLNDDKPKSEEVDTAVSVQTEDDEEQRRLKKKEKLLSLLGKKSKKTFTEDEQDGMLIDPVLADPVTKEPLKISTRGTIIGGGVSRNIVKYDIRSSDKSYNGDSKTYINLLEPVSTDSSIEQEDAGSNDALQKIAQNLQPLIPPPLRPFVPGISSEYIPMRDLFTSPAVSFAYERGWRQGFASAGFPGPDSEFEMASDYFRPVVAKAKMNNERVTLVDMSCGSGLFTRRFISSDDQYDRVLGCDYSDSMLTETRRRINNMDNSRQQKTRQPVLDLVRLDVGSIPMQSDSVQVLHAGAAMHCWPDLPAAITEIHRVLKPGGRYFATTFLSSYFSVLQSSENNSAGFGGSSGMPADGMTRSAFQYFESVDQLRSLLYDNGFTKENGIQIEVLGNACVVIRAEK